MTKTKQTKKKQSFRSNWPGGGWGQAFPPLPFRVKLCFFLFFVGFCWSLFGFFQWSPLDSLFFCFFPEFLWFSLSWLRILLNVIVFFYVFLVRASDFAEYHCVFVFSLSGPWILLNVIVFFGLSSSWHWVLLNVIVFFGFSLSGLRILLNVIMLFGFPCFGFGSC